MDLLIVRHAESQGNASGNYSTAVSDQLSARGEEQAIALADELSSWSFDKIIASPRERALQTITPTLIKTGQTAEIWPEIAEACWHDEREPPAESWEPQPADAVPHFRFRDDRMIKPGHPETFGQGLRRVHDALELLTGYSANSIDAQVISRLDELDELTRKFSRRERHGEDDSDGD